MDLGVGGRVVFGFFLFEKNSTPPKKTCCFQFFFGKGGRGRIGSGIFFSKNEWCVGVDFYILRPKIHSLEKISCVLLHIFFQVFFKFKSFPPFFPLLRLEKNATNFESTPRRVSAEAVGIGKESWRRWAWRVGFLRECRVVIPPPSS